MSAKPKPDKPERPRFTRCRFCELTVTQTAGRYDPHECIGAGQISDFESPYTGDPALDGLIVAVGAILWAIDNMVRAVTDGDFLVASMGHLNAQWWACSATQWVRRFNKEDKP